MFPKECLSLGRIPVHGGKMNQMGMPLLGVLLSALCLLIVGLGAFVRQKFAKRRLIQLRAEYEAKKCCRSEAEGR